MSLKSSRLDTRRASYGQQRDFRGLEKFAIQRRLRAAFVLMDKLAAEDRDLAVLELGCGYYGNNLRALKSAYPQAKFVGVDFSVDPDQPEGIELIRADLRTWAPKTKYDAVLSLAVAEHLSEPQAHFELISNCLRSFGLAGITTPAPVAHSMLSTFARLRIFDRAEIGDHRLYLTESGMRGMAAQADLEILEYKTFSLGFNQWMMMQKN